MWLLLNDCFLSIVSKDCARDELLVRARRAGDIGKIFPGAKVKRDPKADYLFRAVIKRSQVKQAIASEIMLINYPNFKDSVKDRKLRDVYLAVWGTLQTLQRNRFFYGSGGGGGSR